MKKSHAIVLEGIFCILASVGLSQLYFWHLPQGGSFSFEMAPLWIFSYRRGWMHGSIAGVIAGILTAYFDGDIFSPMQCFLDYPLAYACAGIAGAGMKNSFVLSIVAILSRMTCHVVSGVLFFGQYAPVGQNVVVYSIFYNGSFLIPSMAAALAVVWLFMFIRKDGPWRFPGAGLLASL